MEQRGSLSGSTGERSAVLIDKRGQRHRWGSADVSDNVRLSIERPALVCLRDAPKMLDQVRRQLKLCQSFHPTCDRQIDVFIARQEGRYAGFATFRYVPQSCVDAAIVVR